MDTQDIETNAQAIVAAFKRRGGIYCLIDTLCGLSELSSEAFDRALAHLERAQYWRRSRRKARRPGGSPGAGHIKRACR